MGIKRKISSILKVQQIPAHLHGWQRDKMKFRHEWNSMPIYFICIFSVRNPRGQKKLHFFKSNKGQIWVPNTYVFNDVWLNFVLFFKQKNDAVTWSPWILNSDKKKEEFFLSEKFAQCNNLEENEVNSFFTHKWLFGQLPNFGILKNVTNVKAKQKVRLFLRGTYSCRRNF